MSVLLLAALAGAAFAQEDTGRKIGRSSVHLSETLADLGRYEFVVEGIPRYLGHFDPETSVKFVHIVEITQNIRQPTEPPPQKLMWAIAQGCRPYKETDSWTCVQISGEIDIRDNSRGLFFMTRFLPETVPGALREAAATVPFVMSHHRFWEVTTEYGSICHLDVVGEGGGGAILWIDDSGQVVGIGQRQKDDEFAIAHQAEVGSDAWVRDANGVVLGLRYSVAKNLIISAVKKSM